MKLLLVAQFEIQREFIAQNLCENRLKPLSTCFGKCYLKKQLKKEEKSESANNVWKVKSETLFVEKAFEPVFHWIAILEQATYHYWPEHGKHLHLEIFQPPENGLILFV